MVTIEALGFHATDAEIAELADFQREIDTELVPNDPPGSIAELAGRVRTNYPQHRGWNWIARRDGTIVARMMASVDQRPKNYGFVDVDLIEVHAHHRRLGIGTELVRAALLDLFDAGAVTMMTWPHTESGCRFSEHLGMTFRQEERQSRLRVAEVDEVQQDEWIAAPKARSAGYRVVTFVGAVPDDHLHAWAVASDAMADAPLDDLEWTHEPVLPEWVRAVESMHEARGFRRFGALALDADGVAAGMSLLLAPPDRPQLVYQEDTAVVPAHRGFGLGRWLKAQNLRNLREHVPEVELIDTYNAETNGPMLDINVAMGFRPNRTHRAYQAPISTIADRLGVTR